MYRIVDGVKTPYNVLSAREALELSLNDAEREEFCKIIDSIYEWSLDHKTDYAWYYDPKRYLSRNRILALLKYYGYSIIPRGIITESGLCAFIIQWGV